ncbi:hypothetical protein TNCV_2495361 [Trichonephila clavipes]|nr:hypothetical protein TNCV_2495361 [Trichonephila clavipes]
MGIDSEKRGLKIWGLVQRFSPLPDPFLFGGPMTWVHSYAPRTLTPVFAFPRSLFRFFTPFSRISAYTEGKETREELEKLDYTHRRIIEVRATLQEIQVRLPKSNPIARSLLFSDPK